MPVAESCVMMKGNSRRRDGFCAVLQEGEKGLESLGWKSMELTICYLSLPRQLKETAESNLQTGKCKGRYSQRLKSTNCMELCQVSLRRRWIRKPNRLSKDKANPNGTPMYNKLCLGKFCRVKGEETHCGRNYQDIFKLALDLTKHNQIILGHRWFTTYRHQNPYPSPSTSASTGIIFIFHSCSSHFHSVFLPLSLHFPSVILSVSFHFLSFALSRFFRIDSDSQYKKHHESEHHVMMKTL